MARGKSGRVVIKIDPILKRNLYLALEKKQTTLKDWFLETAESFVEANLQSPPYRIEHVAENSTNAYSVKKDRE
jgi:hypothetical protein